MYKHHPKWITESTLKKLFPYTHDYYVYDENTIMISGFLLKAKGHARDDWKRRKVFYFPFKYQGKILDLQLDVKN